jgi:NAD(P)H-dependent FMN reductase
MYAKTAFQMAKSKGIDATFVNLRDYPMPLYKGDLEDSNGTPDNAKKFKKLFVEHDGFFIVSPEYNSSYPPLLKNVIDWISRPDGKNLGEPFKGKTAVISASSPGGLGGMRVLVPLRMLLGNIGVHVIPSQVAVNFVTKAFDADGMLVVDNQRNLMDVTLDELKNTTDALNRLEPFLI